QVDDESLDEVSGRETEFVEANVDRPPVLSHTRKISKGSERQREGGLHVQVIDVPSAPRIGGLAHRYVEDAHVGTGFTAPAMRRCNDEAIVDPVVESARIEDKRRRALPHEGIESLRETSLQDPGLVEHRDTAVDRLQNKRLVDR